MLIGVGEGRSAYKKKANDNTFTQNAREYWEPFSDSFERAYEADTREAISAV